MSSRDFVSRLVDQSDISSIPRSVPVLASMTEMIGSKVISPNFTRGM